MAKKAEFGSKIGLIAATVGSAVGLGNIWRFPAEVQSNGGAAFLLVYILCVFILGIPVMLTEFSLGRKGGSDAVGSLKNVGAPKIWWGVGGMAILASYLILCFYMVVAGWTFEYLWQSITGHLYEPVAGAEGLNGQFSAHMREFITESWNPLVNTYVVIIINLVILLKGVQKGIEPVSMLDLLVAVMMGIIIFPAVMSFNLAGEGLEGATLVFVTLPEVFTKMPGTQLWSILFFLLLLVAALTSTISISEVSIRFLQDRFRLSRVKACVVVLMPLFIFSSICSLSNGVLSHYTIGGMNIFNALDSFATNILLPLGSLLLCIYMGWKAPHTLLGDEITNYGTLRVRFLKVILFIIKYVAPVLILIVLVTDLIK